MPCIVCFDVLVIIWHLKHDRGSHKVIKLFNYSVVMLKLINMAVLMVEDKTRYNLR